MVYDRLVGSPITDPGILLKNHIMEYLPCGRWVAHGKSTGVVTLVDGHSNGEEFVITTHPSAVYGLLFSNCGRKLHSCSADGTIQLSDTERKTSTRFREENVGRLLFSPCGELVAWSERKKERYTGRIHLYDLQSEQETFVLEGHAGRVNSIDWAPN